MTVDVINIWQLSKSFSSIKALQNVSFQVNSNDVFGYLGHNGAGKTTTIRLILGLLKPDAGQVGVLGQDPYPDKAAQQSLRRKIGVLLDKDGLYPGLTGWQNLAFWARLYGIDEKDVPTQVENALRLISLGDRANSVVGTYSKGMRRQLAIARALLNNPEILVLDEPTSGLDPIARVHIRTILGELVSTGKLTIFMSSHDLDEVEKLCNRVVIIEKGEIVLSGSVQDLQYPEPRLSITIKFPSGYPEFPDTLGQKIKGLPFVKNFEFQKDDTLHITLTDVEKSAEVISFLASQGVKIHEAKQNTQSLESVYFQIMNRHEQT
jgi:ABC-2 type transport system ATP-binding protein